MSAALQPAPFIWRPVSATMEACSYSTHEEWLAIRRTGIGSSDAAAACGLSTYDDNTPLSKFEIKAGLAPEPDLSENEAVEIGNALEPFVAKMYAKRTGAKLRKPGRVYRLRDAPFMLANVDYEVVGEPELVEVKTVGFTSHGFISPAWGEDGSPNVPDDVYFQAEHQLAVTGRKICYIAAFKAGIGLHIHPIERDEDAIANLRAVEETFWQRVLAGDPPAPTTAAEVQRLFPKHAAIEVPADEQIAAVAARYAELSAQANGAKKILEELKDRIVSYLGEADTLLVNGKPYLTSRVQTRGAYSVAESTFRVVRILKEKK
jgi:putative phage-type endonuclease